MGIYQAMVYIFHDTYGKKGLSLYITPIQIQIKHVENRKGRVVMQNNVIVFFFMLRNSDVSDIQEIDANAFLVDTCNMSHCKL